MGGCEREGVRWEGGTCHNDKPGPSDAEWNLVEIKWWRYFFPLPFAGGAKTAGFPPHVCMSWPLLSVYIFFLLAGCIGSRGFWQPLTWPLLSV